MAEKPKKLKFLNKLFGRPRSEIASASIVPLTGDSDGKGTSGVREEDPSHRIAASKTTPGQPSSTVQPSPPDVPVQESGNGNSKNETAIAAPSAAIVHDPIQTPTTPPLNPYRSISGLSAEPNQPHTLRKGASEVAGSAYEGFKSVLKVIERSSDMLLPLKLPVAALLGVMEIVDKTIENKEEFKDMERRLNVVISIVQKYDNSPRSSPISLRVKQLAEDLQLHVNEIQRQRDHDLIRRIGESAKDADSIVKCFRNISFLLSAFQMDTMLSAEANTDKIARDVSKLHREATLNMLRHVPAASFEAQRHDGCMEGTRDSILRELFSWAIAPDSTRVYWLSGMAGMGKSAIALSFSRWLDRNRVLGGSFFCSRQGSAERRDAGRIFPTIARIMARLSPPYAAALLEALEEKPDSAHFSISDQFITLIEEPVKSVTKQSSPTLVVIVDALDECENEDDIGKLLRIVLNPDLSLPIKFFITSRPELRIRDEFDDPESVAHTSLRLHDIEEAAAYADIEFFLKAKFKELRKKRRNSPIAGREWPSDSQLSTLVRLADKLFIYAFTAYEFIKEPKADPEERLAWLLSSQSSEMRSLNRPLDDMYRLILQTALTGLEDREIANFKRTLSAVVSLRDPLTVGDLGHLLGIKASRVRAALLGVHSLVRVPETDNDDAILAIHASFVEYILDPVRSKDEKWLVEPISTHLELGHRCLDFLIGELEFNISSSETSCLSNLEQSQENKVPLYLVYASRFWVDHVVMSAECPELWSKVRDLLHSKFLYWLEVLSVSGKADEASRSLRKLVTSSVDASMPEDIWSFIRDANEFVIAFREPLSFSAPHIYLSALPFTRRSSLVVKLYQDHFPLTLTAKDLGTAKVVYPTVCIEKHKDIVQAVGFSPDGHRIVSASSDHTIQIWDAKTGEAEFKPLRGHGSTVNHALFSPDGRHIVSCSDDRTIRLWDAATAGELLSMEGHTGSVNSVAFSSDGLRLVSGSADREIRIWNVETGKLVTSIPEAQMDEINSVAFSPGRDRKLVVSGSADMTVGVWNANTGKPHLNILEGHQDDVLCVAFSPDGRRIVSASMDCTLRIWAAHTGECLLAPFVGHLNFVSSVMFSRDGLFLVSGSLDKTIRIWEAETGKQMIAPLEGHTAEVRSVAFSLDHRRVVSGSVDCTVQIWDVDVGEEPVKDRDGHSDWVRSAAISPNGCCVASASDDGTIRLWDLGTEKLATRPLGVAAARVYSVAFTPDGKLLISGSSDGIVRMWNVETGEMVLKPLEGHTKTVTSVRVSPSGLYIASGSFDATIRIWKVVTGEAVLEPLSGHTKVIHCVAYSGDGRRIVSGAEDCTVRVWEAETGRMISTLTDEGMEWVISVAFSPNGLFVASGSRDHVIRIWDTESSTVWKYLRGHTDWVKAVVYSPNGMQIASGGRDRVIRLWNVETGELAVGPWSWKGHTDWVNSLAFSSDGEFIVSGSSDCTIRVWEAELDGTHSSKPLASHPKSQVLTATHTHDLALVFVDSETSDVIPAHLNPKGWIVGPQDELLVWIPPEYRRRLWWKSTAAILGVPVLEIDLSQFVHGKDWVRCSK